MIIIFCPKFLWLFAHPKKQFYLFFPKWKDFAYSKGNYQYQYFYLSDFLPLLSNLTWNFLGLKMDLSAWLQSYYMDILNIFNSSKWAIKSVWNKAFLIYILCVGEIPLSFFFHSTECLIFLYILNHSWHSCMHSAYNYIAVTAY